MVDLNVFDKSLKLRWIGRIFENNTSWKFNLEKTYPIISSFHKLGDSFGKRILNDVKNPFWNDVFKYYYLFHNKYICRTLNELEATSFLFNSNITIGNKPIRNMNMAKKGVYQIMQIKEGNRYLTRQEINTKFNTKLNFLQYRSLLNAIKTYTSKFEHLKPKAAIVYQPFLNLIISSREGTSKIYHELVEKASNITGLNKSITKINATKQTWEKSFKSLKSSTKDTKLWWMQFRILHHILTTNRSISKFKIEQSHLCTFCKAHSETMLHLFWECSKSEAFWSSLSKLINKRVIHSNNFRFTKNLVFFGICEIIKTDAVCDFMILMAKYYIYR